MQYCVRLFYGLLDQQKDIYEKENNFGNRWRFPFIPCLL